MKTKQTLAQVRGYETWTHSATIIVQSIRYEAHSSSQKRVLQAKTPPPKHTLTPIQPDSSRASQWSRYPRLSSKSVYHCQMWRVPRYTIRIYKLWNCTTVWRDKKVYNPYKILCGKSNKPGSQWPVGCGKEFVELWKILTKFSTIQFINGAKVSKTKSKWEFLCRCINNLPTYSMFPL